MEPGKIVGSWKEAVLFYCPAEAMESGGVIVADLSNNVQHSPKAVRHAPDILKPSQAAKLPPTSHSMVTTWKV